jgi:hypothetical protein
MEKSVSESSATPVSTLAKLSLSRPPAYMSKFDARLWTKNAPTPSVTSLVSAASESSVKMPSDGSIRKFGAIPIGT